MSIVLAALLAIQSAAGRWEGTMQRGTSTLSIAVDLPADQPSRGFFTAGDLGAMEVPLTNVRVDGDAHWELVGDRSTIAFDGKRSQDIIRGTFTEGETHGVFRLQRRSSSTKKPYTSDEVHFSNGGVTLAGTIFTPRAAGKHPAVVFLHGSGPEGRWANGFIADFLARHGVASLIYDKRGVGASAGDWKTSTLDDLDADARAAVHLLASRGDVDPHRVGVYGHSQGGFIAPMVAANNPDVAWIIDADGNVGPQYEQDLFRVETALAKRYHGEALRDATSLYREFVDVARNGPPHEQFNADKAKSQSAPWFDDLALPDDANWIWAWYRGVGNADNRAAWRSIHVPVLMLYGGNDEVVPPRPSIDAITAILKASHDSDVTVHVFPGADHTLRVPPANPQGWPHFAAGFPALVAQWIGKH
jgi:pimeloyl-ACP methyl ester carboxylesterase